MKVPRTMFKIKVDTSAIARNGEKGRGLSRYEYEPTIIVGDFLDGVLVNEYRVYEVEIFGPSRVIQSDGKPGFIDNNNHGARVWIEAEPPIRTDRGANYES